MHNLVSSTYIQTHLPVLILKISDYKQEHWKKSISPAEQFIPHILDSLLLNLQLDAVLGYKSNCILDAQGLLFTALRLVLYSTENYHW